MIPALDARLRTLLRIAIEDVIETGEPVGSQRLVEEHRLDMSPATVRNWFAILEECGYLEQPHTSAGRLPTEQGYRYYLEELMEEPVLHQQSVERLAALAQADNLRQLAAMMAEMAEDAVVFAGESHAFSTGLAHLFAQPEFRDHEQIITVGAALDRMDEILTQLRSQTFDEPTALIGRDCPFGPGCGAVFLTVREGSLLGVLGPLRMDYGHGFALLRRLKLMMND
jgi:transcriptional regulator of heat shock response